MPSRVNGGWKVFLSATGHELAALGWSAVALAVGEAAVWQTSQSAGAAVTPEVRPWQSRRPPSRILAIRLQAIGDVVITLPYLGALGRLLPSTEIDFMTRDETAEVPRAVRLFARIDALGGRRNERLQLALALARGPQLLARRYDVVIDLQNNRVSRTLTRMARPRAWSTFDRESLVSAGERTRRAIAAAGFPLARVEAGFDLHHSTVGEDLLRAVGWDARRPLVVLSPAGGFPSRNWPLDRYVQFAEQWRGRHHAQFAVLGIGRLADKAAVLSRALGSDLLNLVGRTRGDEAFAIVRRASLVLTEDSGLMHMAWTSGAPTLALFGSTRHAWSTPLGPHTLCLHSGDLECGSCMDAECRFGDVHCLTRYTAEFIVEQAEALVARAAVSDRLV